MAMPPFKLSAFSDMFAKKADPFYPMPNTGIVLDISAGHWVKGHKGQSILNGGFALFWSIGAMPNMFKSTIAAYCSAAVLRAFSRAVLHVHDAETTMVIERMELLVRLAMQYIDQTGKMPESLIDTGRMFFTRSVDYDATDLFDLLKTFCKKRLKEEKKRKLEIMHPDTGKPYEYFDPIVSFWDSFSAMKAKNAVDMLAEGDVGSKDLNMLAMRVNSGKSQMVDQIPDMTAKHSFYLLATSQVGQAYELDPKKPSVKTLKMLKGEVKLKRVPENFSFATGNCYIVTHYSPMINGSGKDAMPEFPYEPGDADNQNDLIQVKLTNMRGKFGISGVPLPFVISQKDGLLPEMSNFIFLRDEAGRFGIINHDANNRYYSMALTPDIKMQRTEVRQKFRQNPHCGRSALICAEMFWMFTYWTNFDQRYVCDPVELYAEIKNMGYDWNLLLSTRYWFMPIEDGESIPYLSTMDLLRMRVGQYHPYWYPKSRKEMGLPEIVEDDKIFEKEAAVKP